MKNYSAVDFAYEVIQMSERLRDLEMEVEHLREYKEMYDRLLNDTLAHNERMAGNMLKIAATPGVLEALQTNQKNS